MSSSNITRCIKKLTDILSKIPTICIPCTVDLNSQRSGSIRLGRIPGDEPERRMVTTSEVYAGNLEESLVNISLVERYGSVGCYLLVRAAPHGIEGAFNHGVGCFVGESDRSLFGIVDSGPDSCIGFDERLIAVGIELRREGGCSVLGNGGVLLERVRLVHGCLAIFQREFSIPDVVVGVLVLRAIDLCRLVPTCADLCRLVPTCVDLCRLVLTCADLC